MSGFRKNTKRAFTNLDTRSFYLVASDVFFGLIFSSTEDYTFKKNRSLTTTPSFLFYDSQTKVVIDYSNSKNPDDLAFISSFFNSVQSGITFEFSNANYVEDSNNVKSNLSGIYTFKSFDQNTIIRAELVSATNVSTKKDLYNPKFFVTTPQLSKVSTTVSSSNQRKNLIKNTLSNGLFSFTKMGVRIGDYIEFSGSQSNQNKKFKVMNIFVDSDGFENLQVDQTIANENLIGSPILVNLYLQGESKTNANINDKTYGTCVLNFPQGSPVCIPCQNMFLCDERKKQLNAILSTYTANTTCEDVDIEIISQQSQQFIAGITSSAQTTTEETVGVVESVSYVRPKTKFNIIELKKTNNTLASNSGVISELQVDKNTTLKFILTSPTLLNNLFTFSSTEPNSKITRITEDVLNIGLPGTSNSYISIKTGQKNTTFYLTSADRKLSIKINVK
jgi:hypothetical protein